MTWYALYHCGCVYAIEDGNRPPNYCPDHHLVIDVGHRTREWIERERGFLDHGGKRNRHNPW